MPIHVLVADDSPTIRRRAASTLGDAGYEVTCVEDGARAWEALEQGTVYGALLCDILMPNLDGYELCRRVKGDARLAGLPVLLLRGTFEPWDQARAEAVGADGFITKPFDSDALLGTLGEVVAEMAAGGMGHDEGLPTDTVEIPGFPAPAREVVSEPDAFASPGEDPVSKEHRTTVREDAMSSTLGVATPAEPDWSPSDAGESQPVMEAAATESRMDSPAPPRPEDLASPIGAPDVAPLDVADPLGGSAGDPFGDPFGPGEPDADSVADDDVLLTGSAPAPTRPEPVWEPEALPEPARAEVMPAPAPVPVARTPIAPAASSFPAGTLPAGMSLDDDAFLDRLAERVVQRISAQQAERIAWEVVPEVAEALVRKRLIEIESRLTQE